MSPFCKWHCLIFPERSAMPGRNLGQVQHLLCQAWLCLPILGAHRHPAQGFKEQRLSKALGSAPRTGSGERTINTADQERLPPPSPSHLLGPPAHPGAPEAPSSGKARSAQLESLSRPRERAARNAPSAAPLAQSRPHPSPGHRPPRTVAARRHTSSAPVYRERARRFLQSPSWARDLGRKGRAVPRG